MNRYRLSLAYDGKGFSGWGVQTDTRTVQKTLEEACRKIYGEVGEVTAAGRTDAGVHALGQTVHVDLPSQVGEEDLLNRLNAVLPEDLVVQGAASVTNDFHARFNCLAKTYCYRIWNGQQPPLFERFHVLWIRQPLNKESMKEAMDLLKGQHDFAAFQNSGGAPQKSTVRFLFDARLEDREPEIILSFTGDGFLYNMVRIMVGTFIEVGLGKRDPVSLKEVLESKDRGQAGKTAAALGLCLAKTYYQGDEGAEFFNKESAILSKNQ